MNCVARRLLIGLAFLVIASGILSAWLARRVIAQPLIIVVDELRHVERFELDKVRRHPSRVVELANLSTAIADMAGGLAAFRKYIPADLVRTLLREGIEPRPGGSIRMLTVMFTDIAGFTGLSDGAVRLLCLMECRRNTPVRYVRKIAPPWSRRSPAGAVGSMNLSPSKRQPRTASPSERGAASAR